MENQIDMKKPIVSGRLSLTHPSGSRRLASQAGNHIFAESSDLLTGGIGVSISRRCFRSPPRLHHRCLDLLRKMTKR